jgi:flagellar biosynthesis/type III secretory pathway protein FliH
MSGIVKASSVSFSDALLRIAGSDAPTSTPNPAPVQEDLTSSLKARVDELEQKLRIQLEEASLRERDAYEKGSRDGAEKMASELQKRWDREAQAIGQAAAEALERFEAHLAHWKAISLEIAEAALDRVIGDSRRYAELLTQTIVHHLEGIQRSVVCIAVSARDFPGDEAMALLAELPDHLRRTVEVRQDLPSGSCLVDLTLGHADLGVPSQHERLSKTFAALKAHE